MLGFTSPFSNGAIHFQLLMADGTFKVGGMDHHPPRLAAARAIAQVVARVFHPRRLLLLLFVKLANGAQRRGVRLDPNLLSELRAPAANLAALSAVILAGVFRTSWAPVSATVAVTVFLAFPAGRIVGLLIDGMPSASVLGAFAIEIAIGAICLAAFLPRRAGGVTGSSSPGSAPFP